MQFNFTKFQIKNKKESLRVFGNLPYHIATQIAIYMIKHINCIFDIHFMFQKEIADRLLAIPGNKKYGKLSVIMQYFFKITSLLQIPSKSFFPKPKVNSTLLKLVPKKEVLVNPINQNIQKFLNQVTTTAFINRRKMIKNSLSNLFESKDFKNLEINSTLRAEDLSLQEYLKLAFFLSKKLLKT